MKEGKEHYFHHIYKILCFLSLYNVFLLISSAEKRQINVEDGELIEPETCEWSRLVHERVCNSKKGILLTQTIFKHGGF